MNICVFCSSSSRIDVSYLLLAAELGTEIARRGHGLVSGGGSISCMGEVARAARAGGGHTIGVIPHSLWEQEYADEQADQLVVVDTMRERKATMEARADAFIAMAGGIGTLEELLEVWTARSLGLHNKPVVVLDADGVFAPLRGLSDHLVRAGFIRDCAADLVHWADSVSSALDACEAEPTVVLPAAEELLESEPGRS